MIILYRLYQLFIAAPLIILSTIIACTTIIIGCTIGKANVWSYYPSMVWGRFLCWIMLLPVKVEGRELLDDKQSYVFVANHQGSYDIFLIYGFLGRSFRWMMKKSLRKTPLIGKTCESAGHIFVDKSGQKAIIRTGQSRIEEWCVAGCFPRGCTHLRRAHDQVPPRSLPVGRRVEAARSARHHRRLLRRSPPSARHQFRFLAPTSSHYPCTDCSRRTRSGECSTHTRAELRNHHERPPRAPSGPFHRPQPITP